MMHPMALQIEGMLGLGDNIFARPFVRAQTERYDVVQLRTSWPELFADLPRMEFLRPSTRLRTQAKNVTLVDCKISGMKWSAPRVPMHKVQVSYHTTFRRWGITRSIEKHLPLFDTPYKMDLPDFGVPPWPSDRPLAVIRPVTVRSEWRNEARNPKPEYINRIAARLMDTHHVVVVADLQDDAEWLVGDMPPHHRALVKGELHVRSLLGLVQHADVVVGGVGWIAPAGIAAGVRTFIVHGGHGGDNAPGIITDPRMDLHRYGYALPDTFCTCTTMRHTTCDKTISNLESQWNTFAKTHSLPTF